MAPRMHSSDKHPLTPEALTKKLGKPNKIRLANAERCQELNTPINWEEDRSYRNEYQLLLEMLETASQVPGGPL